MEQQRQRASDTEAWSQQQTPQTEASVRDEHESLRIKECYDDNPLLPTEFIDEIDVDQLVAELGSQASTLLPEAGSFFPENTHLEALRGSVEFRGSLGIRRGAVAPVYAEESGEAAPTSYSVTAARISGGAGLSSRHAGEPTEMPLYEASSLGKRPSALANRTVSRSRTLAASLAAAAGSSTELRIQFEERLRKLEQDYIELCRYVNEIQANAAIERHAELHRLQRDNAELAALNRRLAEELARMQKRLQEGHSGAQS
jgi:hypothetical protein